MDSTGGATLTGTTSQTVDYGTDGTAVTATPPEGWFFVRWLQTAGEGVWYSLENPLTVTNVTGDKTIEAQFSTKDPALNTARDAWALLE